MASATKQIECVTLTLTLEEARMLAVLLSRVSGSFISSPREHANGLLAALYDIGVGWSGTVENDLLPVGAIYFRDYPAEG